MRYSVAFIISALLLTACTESPQKITNKDLQSLWMGGAYELDSGEYQPFAVLWKLTHDTLSVREFDKQWFHRSFKITRDSVYFGNLAFHVKFLQLNSKHLKSNPIYPLHLYKISKTETLHLDQVKELLTESNWHGDSEALSFDNDGTFSELPKGQPEYYRYCYKTDTVEGRIFLYKYGNHRSCKNNFQFIEQVLSISTDELKVLRWKDGDFQEVIYHSQPKKAFGQPSDFQLCNKYLYLNYPLHRYYYKGTVYNGGLYNINKIVNSSYKVPENTNDSGLIRMRFVVNCEGKAGRFEMLELDADYKKTKFDPAISSQIFEITEKLQDWKPGRDEQGHPVDTYRLLTFRIKNGKIIDIFP